MQFYCGHFQLHKQDSTIGLDRALSYLVGNCKGHFKFQSWSWYTKGIRDQSEDSHSFRWSHEPAQATQYITFMLLRHCQHNGSLSLSILKSEVLNILLRAARKKYLEKIQYKKPMDGLVCITPRYRVRAAEDRVRRRMLSACRSFS